MILSVVVPVRDETTSLKIMIKFMAANLEFEYEVLVVYDDPEDASVAALEEIRRTETNVRGILNGAGPGACNAIRAGLAEATGRYALIFVADDITPILAIPHMVALMNEGCDFVSMTRYAHGGRRFGGSRIGHFLSWTGNSAFRVFTGNVLSDCTCGGKMFRRELFEVLLTDSRQQGWGVIFEMAIEAQRMRLRLGEVPSVSTDRLFGGKSTFQAASWTLNYLDAFLTGLRKLPPRPFTSKPKVMVRFPEYAKES